MSVSTTVTGSVGLLFARTAPSPSPALEMPKTSARRPRTKAAASAARFSATERSRAEFVVRSCHRPIASQSPPAWWRGPSGHNALATAGPQFKVRVIHVSPRRFDDQHRPRDVETPGATTQRHGFGIDVGGSGIKGGIVDLDTGQLIGDRIKLLTRNRPLRWRSPKPSPRSSTVSAGGVRWG